MPCHRDPGRVAAEAVDVLLHPPERSDLVVHAEVGDDAAGGVIEVAETLHAEPVVDRHLHHAVAGERSALVHSIAAGTDGEAAAVQPHQHRQAGVAGPARAHVQRERALR